MKMEEKIIEFVRDNPALWNKCDIDFKNTKLKDKKWNKIATSLGISEDTAKKRWKTIRDRYFRILKLEENALLNQQGHVTKYKYADMLGFLKGNSTKNKRSSLNICTDDPNNINLNSHEFLMEPEENSIKYEYIDGIEETPNENHDNSSTLECCFQQQNENIESKPAISSNNSPAHLFMMSLALQIDRFLKSSK
ncbi:transcription factor Adf-1-like [Lucilia sericata]|uniref:transcription factor Adf-1-like n=1 Tax=Lucilia sericata TaxID=13632 RepID=UPI0018A85B67|nr:transcription factor Adf-1-like [Lucilia sericata]